MKWPSNTFNPEASEPLTPRQSWDVYFMSIAKTVATRATCARKHVGAVFVRDRPILATGYNGSIKGMEHCDDVGHMMKGGHCVRTIHAEANAIVQAASRGISLESSTCYVTSSPCWECFKLLANLPVRRICYGDFYRDSTIFEAAEKLNIELGMVIGPDESNTAVRVKP